MVGLVAEQGMDRVFVALGALLAFVGVAAGAFGSHALSSRLPPERAATFEVAVRYQLYHALGLLGAAYAQSVWSSPLIALAGWSFVAGIVLFSGSLYALVLSGRPGWGALAPVGGVAFLLGWGLLAAGVLLRESLPRVAPLMPAG